jgi:transmembrane sensor
MSDSGRDPMDDNQLLQEAAAWFARMRGPDAESSREEFEAWLARGALHRRAYNRAAEIFAMGKLLADEDDPDLSDSSSAPVRSRRTALAATAVLLLVVIAAGWLTFGGTADRDSSSPQMAANDRQAEGQAALRITAAGEPRSVRLADGSVVKLYPGTTLGIDYQAALRRLTLDQGAARFDVAHESRPFVVFAGGGSITARGTLFDVALADRRVSVRLIEGVVEVRLPASTADSRGSARQMRLTAGEAVSFPAKRSTTSEQPTAQPSASERSVASAIRDYDSIRLADLVAQANRTASRQIRFADPAIGEREVSGRFRIDDTALLAERLALLFDLAIDRSQAGEIVLRPR